MFLHRFCFFWPVLKTDIGLCSHSQKVYFFPYFMEKIPIVLEKIPISYNNKKSSCNSLPRSNKWQNWLLESHAVNDWNIKGVEWTKCFVWFDLCKTVWVFPFFSENDTKPPNSGVGKNLDYVFYLRNNKGYFFNHSILGMTNIDKCLQLLFLFMVDIHFFRALYKVFNCLRKSCTTYAQLHSAFYTWTMVTIRYNNFSILQYFILFKCCIWKYLSVAYWRQLLILNNNWTLCKPDEQMFI